MEPRQMGLVMWDDLTLGVAIAEAVKDNLAAFHWRNLKVRLVYKNGALHGWKVYVKSRK